MQLKDSLHGFSGTDSIFNISVKFGGFLKAKEVALERIGGIPGVFL